MMMMPIKEIVMSKVITVKMRFTKRKLFVLKDKGFYQPILQKYYVLFFHL